MANLNYLLVGSLLLLVALVIPVDEARAGNQPQWQVVFSNLDSENSYDKANVIRNAADIITVTTKVVYTAKGKADALELLKNPPGYRDLAFTLYVHDTDCRNSKNRLLKVTHYDSKGGQIRNIDLSGTAEWEKIPPKSPMELVADAECPK